MSWAGCSGSSVLFGEGPVGLMALAEPSGPPAGPLVALLVFGIVFLLVLILRLKLQAFLALLVVSVVVAAASRLVNPDAVPLTQVAGTIVDSMGGAIGFIATIIGIGAIFGAMLEHSGGTQSLAKPLVRIFGPEKASWAMLLTGFVISIPVFLDVALVILAPGVASLKGGRSLHPMTVFPIQGMSGSGTRTVPSACWWFSRIAIMARLIATAVPLRVWAKDVPFSPGLRKRMPSRRAW
jgi:hypothetical protein